MMSRISSILAVSRNSLIGSSFRQRFVSARVGVLAGSGMTATSRSGGRAFHDQVDDRRDRLVEAVVRD